MQGLLTVGPHSPIALLIDGPVVGITPDATLQEAAAVMRDNDVSSVLVELTGGIVTERDLTRAYAAGLEPGDGVEAVIVSDPISIPTAATVLDGAAAMLACGIRHLVVVDSRGSPAGVISLRAVMSVLVQSLDPSVWASLRHAVVTHSELWLG